MAPNGSEFSHRVWISFFLFYFLALSFRNFTGSHHIVPMYVCTIFLRNTNSRSSWKRKAGMISQWFWCKYFAHIFILYSKCSKKIYRLPILYLNTAGYSLRVPSVVFLCLGEKKRSVTIPHCVSGGAWNIPHACQNVRNSISTTHKCEIIIKIFVLQTSTFLNSRSESQPVLIQVINLQVDHTDSYQVNPQ